MKVQLLLLLALAGPLCSFTRASPTTLPSDVTHRQTTSLLDVKTTEPTDIITGPPPTSSTALPNVVVSTNGPEAVSEPRTVFTTSPDLMKTSTVGMIEILGTSASTEKTLPPPVTTVAPIFGFATSGEKGGSLSETTEVPTDPMPSEDPAKATIDGGVAIEDAVEEGLSTGQIVGIVIAAIVAVVIVTAVVIAVLRRMGKYSSGQSRKPAKKEGIVVTPLRKKSTKQQERVKFWKS